MRDDIGEAAFPGASILLVDDHPPNLVALQAILEPLGHRLVTAESAEEALRRLAREEFAAILCDIRMSGMDGFDLVARLRAEGLARWTPIVLMSAVDLDRETARRAYAWGAVDFIAKPIDPDLLRWRVGALVSLYRRGEELKRRAAVIADKDHETAAASEVAERAAAIAEEAQRLIRRKDTFLAILGHDLRSPLSTVSLVGRRLAGAADLSERHRMAVARIERAADRMTNMVQDLLDFARTSAGVSFPIRPRVTNLEDLVTAVLDELRDANPTRAIEHSARGDLVVECDPDRIAQALGNLVSNAIQHGEDNVGVTLRAAADEVVVAVHNAGNVIPREAMASLFDPYRSNHSTSSGLGLGLYIVREVVRAHGGAVTVRSTPADGTIFEMRWPRGLTSRRTEPVLREEELPRL